VAQLKRHTALRGLVQALEDASADGATKANTARMLGMFVRDAADNAATIVEAGVLPLAGGAAEQRLGRGQGERCGGTREPHVQ
jgi:hypothetical protein